ncbi:MAG TPA: flagellar basal body rod protein FlgC [Firmicutes bacterium]|nr:flagellar basal body rod protein FlgC [Bacillota bacterium]
MGLFGPLEVSASALTAERLRLDVIANNLANANTTRTPEGGPYRRQVVVFAPRTDEGSGWPLADRGAGGGVRVVGIMPDSAPLRRVYNPGHPDADAEGYVTMPNVDPVVEMVDLIAATRAYEANVTVITETKNMALRALELLRG